MSSTVGTASAVGASPVGTQTIRPAARQYSLAYLTVFGCSPPEMVRLAADAGYDFVGLRPIYMGLPGEPNFALSANPALLRETKAAMAATGVRLHDIELARIDTGLDPKAYVPAMEVGAELGARHVISSIWTADRAFAVDQFAELCDLAKPFGMTVNLEFVTFAGVATLQDAVAVLTATPHDNAGLLIDTLHFSRSRVALAELEAVPRDWFHFVHLCDAAAEIPTTRDGLIHTAREDRLYIGEGGIDLAGILARIPDVPQAIELPHLERVKALGYAEHARRCLESARAHLDAGRA